MLVSYQCTEFGPGGNGEEYSGDVFRGLEGSDRRACVSLALATPSKPSPSVTQSASENLRDASSGVDGHCLHKAAAVVSPVSKQTETRFPPLMFLQHQHASVASCVPSGVSFRCIFYLYMYIFCQSLWIRSRAPLSTPCVFCAESLLRVAAE
jgi:hypothetical protein